MSFRVRPFLQHQGIRWSKVLHPAGFVTKLTNIEFATFVVVSMSDTDLSSSLQMVRESLLKYGLLLHSDLRFPNLVRIVAGETVHGSWWGHPKARFIFQVGGRLTKDPDVLLTKLISGKETYVHRRYWSQFLAVATSKDSWQLSGLTNPSRFLLKEVESGDELRTDELAREGTIDLKTLGEAARQLERRLLIHGDDIHTPRGFHAKLLRSWRRWMLLVDFTADTVRHMDAKKSIEARVDEINREFNAAGALPWSGV